MQAAIFGGPRNLTVGERPDPVIQGLPTRSSASRWLACAGRTFGTTEVSHRTTWARSATNSSASWTTSARMSAT